MNGEIGRTNPTTVDSDGGCTDTDVLETSRDREVPVIETQNADVASEDGAARPALLAGCGQ